MVKYFYEDLRKLAISNGVKDNKVSIGMWLKFKGYKRHHSMYRDRTRYCYYTLDE